MIVSPHYSISDARSKAGRYTMHAQYGNRTIEDCGITENMYCVNWRKTLQCDRYVIQHKYGYLNELNTICVPQFVS